MVRIDVVYRGALRCEAVHEPSRTALVTDAPKDNHGKGESFSPTDLVATALGTCLLTTMGIVAERHGWEIAGTSVSVEKEMVADPVRRIGSLAAVVRLRGRLDADARRRLEQAALACPVHRSLHPDVAAPVRFEDPPA